MITSFFQPKKKKQASAIAVSKKRVHKEDHDQAADNDDEVATQATASTASPGSPAKRRKQKKELDPAAEELLKALPVDNPWRTELHDKVWTTPSFVRLAKYVATEQTKKTIYPTPNDIWTSLQTCPLDKVKVVIVGQDPYHGPNQAHGLCFSVKPGNPIPPSLRNIYKELATDIGGFQTPSHGHLIRWAQQGVLLVNTVWTVRKGEAHSHKKQGWETVTAKVLQALRARPCVFLLWGKPATQVVEQALPVAPSHHVRIASSHPSPLGATKTNAPFIGSRCFSKCNAALAKMGYEPIDWAVDGPLPGVSD
uniref:Uracil-DNA glycosylase n=1 Tax=Amphora coffeiformis TaxID=265554 RepID=A0A7S3KXI7_9STRA|mmetsp:Transcript_6148/g.12053  ORF Transcript_6148/g.12053 Transcript_6148/m.12053 type:complete len:309 (+) Transcript_6148:126-1052(+)|eukprot:scaffold1140_cov157-Amphora_coffeaeformis.AAC.14